MTPMKLTGKICLLCMALLYAMAADAGKSRHDVVYSCTGEQVRIYSSAVTDTLCIFVIADTHLWISDEREDYSYTFHTAPLLPCSVL